MDGVASSAELNSSPELNKTSSQSGISLTGIRPADRSLSSVSTCPPVSRHRRSVVSRKIVGDRAVGQVRGSSCHAVPSSKETKTPWLVSVKSRPTRFRASESS